MPSSIDTFKIDGLAAATFTPYHADGSVDYAGIDLHCSDLAKHEFDSLLVLNGTTGGSMSLSHDERKRVAEALMAAAKGHGTVIINHAGCNSITATRDLAAHAQAIGCAAISVMRPFFFKPTGAAQLASSITGVAVDPLELVKACEALGLPTFRVSSVPFKADLTEMGYFKWCE